jgi:predicted esterase
MLTRREAILRMLAGGLAGAGAAGALGALGGCMSTPPEPRRSNGTGRLAARPAAPTTSVAPGAHDLDFQGGGRGVLYVPAGYRADAPAPLAVLLHGARGTAQGMLDAHRDAADATGLVLLAAESLAYTWDVIVGGYGPDVDYIDAARTWTFGRVAVDGERLGVLGFSDGASYALSLGRINGDLFRRVVAFSPGFVGPGTPTGRPEFFITHGTEDRVLPIAQTSRQIVPTLRAAGYEVDYREFPGGHGITEALLDEAMAWLAAEAPENAATAGPPAR